VSAGKALLRVAMKTWFSKMVEDPAQRGDHQHEPLVAVTPHTRALRLAAAVGLFCCVAVARLSDVTMWPPVQRFGDLEM